MSSVDLIKKNILRLKSSFNARKKANELTENLFKMAYGSWVNKIPRMPGEPTFKDKRTVAPDILGYLLRSFGYLYRSAPTRSASDPSSEEFFNKKLWGYSSGINGNLLLADQLVRISGSILIGVEWTPTPDGSKSPWGDEDGYILTNYTSEKFSVLEGTSPVHPKAIIVKTNSGWQYWDQKVMAELTEKLEILAVRNEEGGFSYSILEHNFGIIPFCVVQNVASWPETFAPRMGGDDLYNTIRNLGGFIRELGWTAVLQRGQPFIKGEAKSGLMLGPDLFIQVDPGGEMGIAPNNANLEGMVKVLQTLLNTLATSLGLPTRVFKIEVGNAVSGVAIQLDQQELEADRQNRKLVFEGVEGRLARIVSFLEVASERLSKEKLNPQVTVGFRQPETIISFAERKERVDWVFSNHLCDPLFALGELYPSATKEEIEKIYEKGKTYWDSQKDSSSNSANLPDNPPLDSADPIDNNTIEVSDEEDTQIPQN